MKRVMKILVAMLLLGSLTIQIQADVFEIKWQPPTHDTAGVLLLEQELDYYTLYVDGFSTIFYDSIPGSYYQLHEIIPAGSYELYLTVTTIENVESGPSNTKVFIVGPRTPMPPVFL